MSLGRNPQIFFTPEDFDFGTSSMLSAERVLTISFSVADYGVLVYVLGVSGTISYSETSIAIILESLIVFYSIYGLFLLKII